jgi:hypothetical protein
MGRLERILQAVFIIAREAPQKRNLYKSPEGRSIKAMLAVPENI